MRRCVPGRLCFLCGSALEKNARLEAGRCPRGALPAAVLLEQPPFSAACCSPCCPLCSYMFDRGTNTCDDQLRYAPNPAGTTAQCMIQRAACAATAQAPQRGGSLCGCWGSEPRRRSSGGTRGSGGRAGEGRGWGRRVPLAAASFVLVGTPAPYIHNGFDPGLLSPLLQDL